MANVVIPEEELDPILQRSILKPNEVRMFIADSVENNHLLDDVEFTDGRIWLAMKMAVSEYNRIPPFSAVTAESFPSFHALMYGVLYHLFSGQMSMSARNHMSYSDGGLNIPIEERYQFYAQNAQMYQGMWKAAAEEIKGHNNIETGWDMVHSDYATFPNW